MPAGTQLEPKRSGWRGPEESRNRFTPEEAREAGKRSAEARRRNRDADLERRAQISRVMDVLDRESLGPFALAGAFALAYSAISGEIPIPEKPVDRLRLAETAQILHRIGRLELGESTANTLSASMDSDRAGRIADLRAKLDALQIDQTTA